MKNPQIATRSMGVAETSPSVPRRDDEGTYKQYGEHPLIASTGPGPGGSTHGYTSWKCTERRRMPNTCAWHRQVPAGILPMPAETNTLHNGKPGEKTLQEHPRSCKAFGGYTRECASAPPRNGTTSRREECPISKRQPLRDPMDITTEARGLQPGKTTRVL
jgi:hypothetical protein